MSVGEGLMTVTGRLMPVGRGRTLVDNGLKTVARRLKPVVKQRYLVIR
jgi:hypothetical protein